MSQSFYKIITIILPFLSAKLEWAIKENCWNVFQFCFHFIFCLTDKSFQFQCPNLKISLKYLNFQWTQEQMKYFRQRKYGENWKFYWLKESTISLVIIKYFFFVFLTTHLVLCSWGGGFIFKLSILGRTIKQIYDSLRVGWCSTTSKQAPTKDLVLTSQFNFTNRMLLKIIKL